MSGRKAIVLVCSMPVALRWPAIAEANGDHFQMGDLHFDPLIAVAVFVGLITLMFVAQWIRFNTRRRAGQNGASEKAVRDVGEGDDDYEQY